jgi:hypothetical protein
MNMFTASLVWDFLIHYEGYRRALSPVVRSKVHMVKTIVQVRSADRARVRVSGVRVSGERMLEACGFLPRAFTDTDGGALLPRRLWCSAEPRCLNCHALSGSHPRFPPSVRPRWSPTGVRSPLSSGSSMSKPPPSSKEVDENSPRRTFS